jgi:hypothetical protein
MMTGLASVATVQGDCNHEFLGWGIRCNQLSRRKYRKCDKFDSEGIGNAISGIENWTSN